jgi:hypothetical protein
VDVTFPLFSGEAKAACLPVSADLWQGLRTGQNVQFVYLASDPEIHALATTIETRARESKILGGALLLAVPMWFVMAWLIATYSLK